MGRMLCSDGMAGTYTKGILKRIIHKTEDSSLTK